MVHVQTDNFNNSMMGNQPTQSFSSLDQMLQSGKLHNTLFNNPNIIFSASVGLS